MDGKMPRPYETALLMAAGFLLYAGLANAAGTEPIAVNIDLEGLVRAINESANTVSGSIGQSGIAMQGSIGAVPNALLGALAASLKGALDSFNAPVADFAALLVTSNPDVTAMRPAWESVTLLVSSLYLLFFMLVGFMFLVSGIDREKRFIAKDWLKNGFMMVVGVAASFEIYRLVLALSGAAAEMLLGTGSEALFGSPGPAGGLLGAVFLGAASVFACFTLFARYMLLMAGAAIFPLGVFMHFVPPLRGWGNAVFSAIGTAIGMQLIDAAILSAAGIALGDTALNRGHLLVPAFSFLLIGFVNMAMLGRAVSSAVTPSPGADMMLAARMLGEQVGELATAAGRVQMRK